MPLISKGTMSSGSGVNSSWRNPNSIIRNTVKVKPGEFALMKFISDRDDGDLSRFHRVTKPGQTGKPFTEYIYCINANRNEVGQVVEGACDSCQSADQNLRKTSPRYGYWVFCYAIFHLTQNPGIDKGWDDAQEWDRQKVGKREMYREVVMKPQLLVMSYPTWEQVDAKAARYGTLMDSVYELSHISTGGRSNYVFEKSELPTPEVDEGIVLAGKNLPDLEKVVAGAVEEFEFPVVDLPEGESKDEEAFAKVVDAPTKKSTKK